MLMLALLTGACTQNHGYIGPIFGTWHLTELQLGNDKVDLSEKPPVTFSFQGTIVMITYLYPYHVVEKSWGTWAEPQKNILELNFSHGNDFFPSGTVPNYSPYPWLELNSPGITALNIKKLNGSTLILEYTKQDGTPVKYSFEKTY